MKTLKVALAKPASYSRLTEEKKKQICNGMGAANSMLSPLIPNTMYGLGVEEAGNIHDYMYHIGVDDRDRQLADETLLVNMLRIINNKGGWLAPLRRKRAYMYYDAVVAFGRDAFYAGKVQ